MGGDRIIQNFVRQLPRGKRRNVLHIARDSQHQIAQYLAVVSLSNLIVGFTTGLICWAVGLPDPAVWGPVGVLLAVPLTTVIQVVLKQIPKLRPIYKVIAR